MNNRDLRLDFFKGMLMLGVVWGHCIKYLLAGDNDSVNIHWILRTFDMPFFMLISGFFLEKSTNKYDMRQLLLNKVTMILIPTIIWSFLFTRFKTILQYYFLWAILFSSIITIFIHQVKNQLFQGFLFIVTISVFYLTPFDVFNMSYLYPFFVIGFLYPSLLKERKNQYLTSASVVGYVFLLCYWNADFSIWKTDSCIIGAEGGKMFSIFFRMSIAFLGVIVVERFFNMIYHYWKDNPNWFYELMIKTGKETLPLYVLQAFVMTNLKYHLALPLKNRLGYNFFSEQDTLLGYFISPILSILIIFILYHFIKMIRRYKWTKKIFGFKILLSS